VYESCGFGWGDCGWYPLADQEGATGSVSGPVGTVFTPLAERFGFPYGFGGLGYGMDCGGWTPNMGSCVRENSGQPALAAWRVYLLERGCDNGQYSCQVTLPFFYQEVTYIAQCQVPPGPVVETRRKTDSTPEGSAGCVGEGLIGPGYCGNFRSCTE
jgi:hypothetical protein